MIKKFRKILRKFQSNFQHYDKKIEAQAKKWFSCKKREMPLQLGKRVFANMPFYSRV